MISKRIFWLTCVVVVSWLIWMRLRQRQDEFAATTPQFAPPRTFTPPMPAAHPTPAAAPTRQPAEDEPSAVAQAPASADIAADVFESNGTTETEISGYCMRCKTKRPIQNALRETTESGRPAARGTCPICGANMFTFLATNDDA
jgi:hypothetical protein